MIEDKRTPARRRANIIILLAMPDLADIEFEPPRIEAACSHPADLS
jgi:hypothetical protein